MPKPRTTKKSTTNTTHQTPESLTQAPLKPVSPYVEQNPSTIAVKQTQSPAGRPDSTFNPDVAKEICSRIANDESLLSICRDPRMPTTSTVHNWLFNWEQRPEFTQFMANYTRARQQQPEATYERLFDIEASVLSGELTPNAARVVIDSMHWRMGKRAPKIYGDVKQLELSGGIDLNVAAVSKPVPVGAAQGRLTAEKRKTIADK